MSSAAERKNTSGIPCTLLQGLDVFFRAVTLCKRSFTTSELKGLLEAHRTSPAFPIADPKGRLIRHMANLCEDESLHTRFGYSRTALDAKLKRLEAHEALALMIWAAAFWRGHDSSTGTMDEYIAPKNA